MARNRLLLVSDDSQTAVAVSAALSANGQFTAGKVCNDLAELIHELERSPSPGVLVDIDREPVKTLSALAPIVGRFRETRFIVLSKVQRYDLVFEAMQAGARHFLLKSAISSQLTEILHRLIPAGTGNADGRIITILSAGGGCGGTTLAVNLTAELRLAGVPSALLVDFDEAYGGIGSYLGMEGQYGVHDVLRNADRIDAELITTTALEHPGGFRVLLSPASVIGGESAGSQYDGLHSFLTACKQTSAMTVVDAPRVPIAVAAQLAFASTAVLLVFQINVRDIRVVQRLLAALAGRGLSSTRVQLVANRFRRRHSMIGRQQAQDALGGVPFDLIRNDYPACSRSLNYGKPLAELSPRSPARKDIRAMALKLNTISAEAPRQPEAEKK